MLRSLLIAYGAASLIHFAHNAAYLRTYPNLPSWLSPAGIAVAWCVLTCIGVLGYYVYRVHSRTAGTLMMAIYGLLGFGGLDHYVVAPMSAHSSVMNATIALEATTATMLLVYLARRGHVLG